MKLSRLFFALLFLSMVSAVQAQKPAPTQELPVKPFGSFWKVRSTGEHAYGYDVEIWKQGDNFYGLISAHEGLDGDPPTGLLENVKYDPRTKKFSFRAKLSLGDVPGKNDDEWVPSHDVFQFEGTLTAARLTGVLRISGDSGTEKKRIDLPRSKQWSAGMEKYTSYKDWKAFADDILDFRGPKW